MNRRSMTLGTAAPALGLLSVLAGAGCDRSDAPGSSSTASHRPGVTNTQAPNASNEPGVDLQAVDVFADAWCEQQRGCERIGEGRPYDSFATCMSEMRRAVSADLRSFDCRRGLDIERTQACQATIERVSCTHTLVTLPSLGECTKDALCAK